MRPFTASCVAGECLGSTTSPTEIKAAEGVANQPPPAAPEVAYVRGLANVRKPARSTYTFFAY